MDRIAPYWKAVVAFLAPGAASIGLAVLPVSDGGVGITGAEWVGAVVLSLVTAGSVYAKANRPIPDGDGEHRA